ncbi:homospermidine synthase [Pseudomonas aeruginosa]|uniref:saccharopine dehydrogenase C-terminal domain-containing protein n=1 Tax=Pseudomonas aeruginosa TaxID=287 RepID=UPI000F89BDCA|nr:saccharopine dehydrogenase C-terminal domain-containing protein [Pseudomonas aeruginosa]RUI00791.1 homospermidine synthase [Pseudomonas aeruginosa]
METNKPLNRIVFVGFGTVANSLLPLISRVCDLSRIEIYALDPVIPKGASIFDYNIIFLKCRITKRNARVRLSKLLDAGSFLINLSTGVSSLELIKICRERGALYIDAGIEPWDGWYTDTSVPPSSRTNYCLRESLLKIKKKLGIGPTAVVAHGANPGLISHFLKRALTNLGQEIFPESSLPKNREEWAKLSMMLKIKAIHIAEYDSQRSFTPRVKDEFTNTWSVDGFLSEAQQPAELGWGTHEIALPNLGRRHKSGGKSSIYIIKPGAAIRVKTWTPYNGPCLGFLITHNESISISDYLTYVADGRTYRPTVYYAYRPCDEAVISLHEWLGNDCREPGRKRILRPDDVFSGADYLGVLVMGDMRRTYWYGSVLTIDQAKSLAPLNTATTLQVAAGVLSGFMWALNNPRLGIVEPEEMDFEQVLSYALPYLGEMKGVYSSWSPLENNSGLFETPESYNVWGFYNFLV